MRTNPEIDLYVTILSEPLGILPELGLRICLIGLNWKSCDAAQQSRLNQKINAPAYSNAVTMVTHPKVLFFSPDMPAVRAWFVSQISQLRHKVRIQLYSF